MCLPFSKSSCARQATSLARIVYLLTCYSKHDSEAVNARVSVSEINGSVARKVIKGPSYHSDVYFVATGIIHILKVL